jgi:hypothetical protein
MKKSAISKSPYLIQLGFILICAIIFIIAFVLVLEAEGKWSNHHKEKKFHHVNWKHHPH